MPGGGLSRAGRALRKANGKAPLRPVAGVCECCNGAPTPCCEPPTPCGQEWEVCITEVSFLQRETKTLRNVGFDGSGDGVLSTLKIRTARLSGGPYRLTLPAPEPGGTQVCDVLGSIPYDRVFEDIVTESNGVGPCGEDWENSPPSTRFIDRICLSALFRCPPEQTATNANINAYVFLPFPVAGVGPFGTQSIPWAFTCDGLTRLFATTTNTNSWRTGIGDNRFDGTNTFSFSGRREVPCGGGTFGCAIETIEIFNTVRVRWKVVVRKDCNGATVDGPCVEGNVNPCNRIQTYRVSSRCGNPSESPVLVPIENVTACGVFEVDGECWQVSKSSPTTDDPAAFGGRISNIIIDPPWPIKTCCECNPVCGSGPIPVQQCWSGGVRNILGDWIPNQGFVTEGPCCCNPRDIINVFDVTSVVKYGFGITDTRQLVEPISVRRGDVWRMPMTSTLTDTATGEFRERADILFGTETDPIAPWDCSDGPWFGGVNAQLFGPGNLRDPQQFVGLHISRTDPGVVDMPCPMTPDGTNGSVRVITKNVAVTCSLFTYDALWEINGGHLNGSGVTVSHRLRLSITLDAGSQQPECTGGCVSVPELPFPPVRPIGPGELTGPGGNVRSILESF